MPKGDYGTNNEPRTWLGEEPEREYPNTISRALLFIGAGILTALAVIAAVVVAIESKRDCADCGSTSTHFYIGAAVLFAVGILGIAAGASRHPCPTYSFAVIVALLAIGSIATAAAMLSDSWSKDLWQDAVKDDPDFVCSIQDKESCSGYNRNCNNHTRNMSSTLSPHAVSVHPVLADRLVADFSETPVPHAEPNPRECSERCQTSNHYAAPCGPHMRTQMRNTAIGFFVLAALLIGLVVASIRMRQSPPRRGHPLLHEEF